MPNAGTSRPPRTERCWTQLDPTLTSTSTRGQYAASLYCVEKAASWWRAIKALSKDLVPEVEVDRARNLLAFLEEAGHLSREDWRVASADLTQFSASIPARWSNRWNTTIYRSPLFDPSRSLDDLIPIGLTNRPELSAQQSLIQAALVRIRQEKMRPLLPLILITGFQTPGGMTTEAASSPPAIGGN